MATRLIVRIWRVDFNCLVQFEFANSATETLSKILVSDVSVNLISTWSTEWFVHILLFDIRLRHSTWEFGRIYDWHPWFCVPGSCMSVMWFVPPWTWTARLYIRVLLVSPKGILRLLLFSNVFLCAKVKRDCGILSRWWSLELTVKAFGQSHFFQSLFNKRSFLTVLLKVDWFETFVWLWHFWPREFWNWRSIITYFLTKDWMKSRSRCPHESWIPLVVLMRTWAFSRFLPPSLSWECCKRLHIA